MYGIVYIQESDGGLFSPDHYIPSPSSSKDPTHISFLQNERMNNRSPTQSYSTSTRLSSQVPQDPITASKKATFKLTRSKTLASEATDSLGNKKMGRPLSVDIPECDEHENSTEDLLKAQRTQSSPLPLPASSPDMVVPTIALARISPRKPLVRQSSSTFLSDLKIQAPLLSKLPVPSVDLPKRGKSAPNSPNIEKDRKGLEWKLGIMKHANKCYSQGDMRQLVDSATSDGDSGSCVAERGEMSDSSSGGLNIPWSMDEGFPSQRLSPRDEIKHGGMASPVSKKVVLCEAASVEHDITAENRYHCMSRLKSSVHTVHTVHTYVRYIQLHELIRFGCASTVVTYLRLLPLPLLGNWECTLVLCCIITAAACA